MDEVEIYHSEPASNSLKVLIAAMEKGLPFRSIYVDLTAFEQHAPAFLEVNPSGQVPVLVHRGKVITESTVINEYIDDAFPGPPLKPEDLFLQAQMRIWTKYVDEVFRPALSFLAWDRVIPRLAASLSAEEFRERLARIPLGDKRDKWERAASGSFSEQEKQGWRRQVAETVRRVETALETEGWLVGDRFTLADAAVFAMAHAMPGTYPELVSEEAAPRMMRWLDRVASRAGVGRAMAMPDRANWGRR
ncbi:glutathione S-transferase [Altererythrobacter atlanticus]|uniref:Glutathione S-transferase n=1 Tax=Croceibacterium atlanticum TaxID=1267766 RepID=A0A0F7KTI7_9SPHN|nr:glutathione S-transferase family protein [Croceibacterium atlanticum]AKH42879.1 Glutathione S-transferase [Croceibacterium atlanticum]MBB5731659.1 glutathione S-transferase [Croceibacterium atlanticum]